MDYASYDPKKVRLHVVVLKAFILGAAITAACVVLAFSSSLQSFVARASIYAMAVSGFYMLEFLTTAVYNTGSIDDDSFIMNDLELHAVHVASLAESYFLHKHWKYHYISFWAGLAIMLASQFCRTLAMYTAGTSFHHYVQKERSQKHVLVEHGIYSFSRHPSYFGFFWWFVGCQILFQNAFTLVVGTYKLQGFFQARIEYEEQFLESFFGERYRAYSRRTRTWIPFIE